MVEPYYQDAWVTLYHGDMLDLLPALGITADACVTDPPYGETSLAWDRWPEGWPLLMTWSTNSMWCFGSMRMFTRRWAEFNGWKLSQDIVWEKQAGSGFAADRFKRVHEHALHFYHGDWAAVHHEAVRVVGSFGYQGGGVAERGAGPIHMGKIKPGGWEDDGTRIQRSVIKVRNCHGRAIHPTEKPIGIFDPLIRYSSPLGGLVLDPFAGSCSTLLAARQLGRRAIGIEANEEYCERAAARLSTPDLFADTLAEIRRLVAELTDEQLEAMDEDRYVVTGNKRERVRQLGNGVTPPAAEWLIRAVVESLAAPLFTDEEATPA